MGKRFTATDKWTDKWFRALSPEQKLGWLYLCDSCDAAGVIDLDRDLANFQIGFKVDWDALTTCAGERMDVLPNGKLWLVRFISYQYGRLSENCSAHVPIFASLEKHKLTPRVFKGYSKAIYSLKDKEEETDKDKETEEDQGEEGMQGGKGKPKAKSTRFVPPTLDEVATYCRERGNDVSPSKFVDHYESNGWLVGKNKMKSWQATVRKWEQNNFTAAAVKSDPRGTFAAAEEYLFGGAKNGQ